MAGDELYNYLLKHGALPPDKVQKIFTQLVGAVAYVHSKSCVHRDLKLENILLDKNENVKLCDFGFTREYEGKASYLQTFCGTVCYSAPEMLKGEKYAGEKVDVWSLGVILYALLTGELPFDEDDDNATKGKILGTEPRYPDHLPAEARTLIQVLLSKRPLLRPTLSEILAMPFLAEHAPQQQAMLKLKQPAPFTTRLEKETLERMRSAGVDIDKVIENVLAQRCDTLAGWWALLIEKEERKEKRRERKRREKEAENRILRRLSAASSRMDRGAPALKEVDEEQDSRPVFADSPGGRGRMDRQSSSGPRLVLPEMPRLSETLGIDSAGSTTPPPPIEKDSIRSVSSSRHRPPLPPKEAARRSRNSTLQMVASNPELLSPTGFAKRRNPRRHQHPIMNQLAQIKHWLVDSAKRAKSPGAKMNASSVSLAQSKPAAAKQREVSPQSSLQRPPEVNSIPGPQSRNLTSPPPVMGTPRKRSSLSPSPMTPHSSYRRTSTGLRGRKSTSSSVSSIRSIHHHHSHSKASSTSSASITSSAAKTPRSPRTSIKVLPATPTATSFPSNIRVVRSGPSYNETANFGLQSPGLIFAKRKKTPFKGPMLSVSTSNGAGSSRRDSSLTRNVSAAGRRSGEIIEEEDEEGIEEVDAFSPIVGPGEIEETFEEPARHPFDHS
ncbi:MAG: hypothetical protein M1832_003261 [Thelocarpon impressellum]|nr:MAG: hypothetical protein M1832_003261 [Thelocarpon impressellum]